MPCLLVPFVQIRVQKGARVILEFAFQDSLPVLQASREGCQDSINAAVY
jgi:hypothetical protein